jgi:hypothetical protein
LFRPLYPKFPTQIRRWNFPEYRICYDFSIVVKNAHLSRLPTQFLQAYMYFLTKFPTLWLAMLLFVKEFLWYIRWLVYSPGNLKDFLIFKCLEDSSANNSCFSQEILMLRNPKQKILFCFEANFIAELIWIF